MSEERIVWEGRSSQWIHLPLYLACVLVVPIPFGVAKWIQNRCRRYTITTERLRITSGVFNRKTEEVEFYRVNDYAITEPLRLRIFGLGNVVLHTADDSSPTVVIEGVRASHALRDEIRKHVEACRDKKRVRVSELET